MIVIQSARDTYQIRRVGVVGIKDLSVLILIASATNSVMLSSESFSGSIK